MTTAYEQAVERLAMLVGQDWIASDGERLSDEEIAKRILRDLTISVGLVAIDPALVEAVRKAEHRLHKCGGLGRDESMRRFRVDCDACVAINEARRSLADAVLAQVKKGIKGS